MAASMRAGAICCFSTTPGAGCTRLYQSPYCLLVALPFLQFFFYKAGGTTDRRLYRRQDIEESLRAPW